MHFQGLLAGIALCLAGWQLARLSDQRETVDAALLLRQRLLRHERPGQGVDESESEGWCMTSRQSFCKLTLAVRQAGNWQNLCDEDGLNLGENRVPHRTTFLVASRCRGWGNWRSKSAQETEEVGTEGDQGIDSDYLFRPLRLEVVPPGESEVVGVQF
jgi:hypothetical protein